MSLDLYAKAEHLLGIEESTERLHDLYIQTLKKYPVKTLLDIGCGRGFLMEKVQELGMVCTGIDQSAVMVDAAAAKGLTAAKKGICEVEGSYDAAVAVFDVLNFLDKDGLFIFLQCVAQRLNPGGIFIADINTLHGFTDVAEGTMTNEDENHFLTVDAYFESEELHTEFTLFTKSSPECWVKEQSEIVQWFHPLKRFRNVPNLKLTHYKNISLYDTNDKMLLVFQAV
ncbi:class I SAM-dependent methyltransferase [Sulfurimonas sp. HSL-1656]|uniref:class I SAM-dependent DNA methyltransferase n=1 Tax=Thiomicrolovo subterrani TaxID=3131934 RepID=UPI0031F8E39E